MSDKRGIGKKNYLTHHVHCPNWTCGGTLYLVEPIAEGKKGYQEGAWQVPDIRCDDCGTTWHNNARENFD